MVKSKSVGRRKLLGVFSKKAKEQEDIPFILGSEQLKQDQFKVAEESPEERGKIFERIFHVHVRGDKSNSLAAKPESRIAKRNLKKQKTKILSEQSAWNLAKTVEQPLPSHSIKLKQGKMQRRRPAGGVNELYRLVKAQRRVTLKEVMKRFAVSEEVALKWVGALQSRGQVRMREINKISHLVKERLHRRAQRKIERKKKFDQLKREKAFKKEARELPKIKQDKKKDRFFNAFTAREIEKEKPLSKVEKEKEDFFRSFGSEIRQLEKETSKIEKKSKKRTGFFHSLFSKRKIKQEKPKLTEQKTKIEKKEEKKEGFFHRLLSQKRIQQEQLRLEKEKARLDKEAKQKKRKGFFHSLFSKRKVQSDQPKLEEEKTKIQKKSKKKVGFFQSLFSKRKVTQEKPKLTEQKTKLEEKTEIQEKVGHKKRWHFFKLQPKTKIEQEQPKLEEESKIEQKQPKLQEEKTKIQKKSKKKWSFFHLFGSGRKIERQQSKEELLPKLQSKRKTKKFGFHLFGGTIQDKDTLHHTPKLEMTDEANKNFLDLKEKMPHPAALHETIESIAQQEQPFLKEEPKEEAEEKKPEVKVTEKPQSFIDKKAEQLYQLIQDQGKLTFEQVAKRLKADEELVSRWAKLLENQDKVNVEEVETSYRSFIGRKKTRKEQTISLKIKLAAGETMIDALYHFVQDKGKVRLTEVMKIFSVSEEVAAEWAWVLESNNLIAVKYPTFGGPVLTKRETKGENK